MDAPIQKINVHLRGGFIIPMQIPGSNIILGRGNPFTLLVASSSSGNATGNLYWDDGDSIGIDVFFSLSFSSNYQSISDIQNRMERKHTIILNLL